MRRSARSVRTPARLAEEALPIIVRRRRPASADRRAAGPIIEWSWLFGVYASVYVESHPSESPSLFDWVTSSVLRGASTTSASATSVPWCDSCCGTLSTGTWRWALYTVPPFGAAGTASLSPRGDIIILECGSCASNLSTSSIAPVQPVGSGMPALCAARVTQPSRTCHAVSAGKRI